MHQWQIEELALRFFGLQIPALGDRAFGGTERFLVRCKRLPRAAEHIAWKLIKQDHIGHGALGVLEPVAQATLCAKFPCAQKAGADRFIKRIGAVIPALRPYLV